MFKHIMESELFQFTLLVLTIITVGREIRAGWKLSRKHTQRYQAEETYRDKTHSAIFYSTQVFFGYIIPLVFLLWSSTMHSWLSWWIIPNLIGCYILVNSIALNWMLHQVEKMFKEIDGAETKQV